MPDCLIVGAGVIGLSLAYELAGHGMKVSLLERRSAAGREASWAGAGILPPAGEHGTHPLDPLRRLSFELHPEWSQRLQEETGIDTGYRRCGGLYLARSAGDSAALTAWVAQIREEGVRVEQLRPVELAAAEPALSAVSQQLRTCYRLPDESQLRNPRHLQALLAACRKRGVTVNTEVEARNLNVVDGRLISLSDGTRSFPADQFCFCGGAWTNQILAQLQIANGMLPIRGQMLMYALARPILTQVINEGPRYLVPRTDGRLLVGSSEEQVGFCAETTPLVLRELRELAESLLPELAEATLERSWAGLRPGTFDGFPYIGPVPGVENAFLAAGHYRSGLFLSPGTAVAIGRLIRGLPAGLELHPFRVGRG